MALAELPNSPGSLVEFLVNELFNELERQYRNAWKGYSPARCRAFVEKVSDSEEAKELLVRLLCIDLELSRTLKNNSAEAEFDDDESRVSPCVELLKIQFPELEQNPLGLERLLVLDFALRIQHEEQSPNIDSYLAVYPSARLLRNLDEAQARLQELKYNSTDDFTSGPSIDKTKSTVPQSSTLNSLLAPRVPFTLGRFLLIRYIGRGGMGFVYAAIDLSSTAQVAVKMMRRGDGWSVFRFIEEFRWLNQLNHPNLVRLYAAFAEGDARYFSMEYIEGKDIRQWYREVKQTDSGHFSMLKQSLRQLASAIHFLHTQGVIHRDIKCSNVMITPRGRTVLLDLGLAIRQTDQNQVEMLPTGDAMPGTLMYMSPEAYNNQRLTPASDWYSLGVTIYELLVGEVPQASIEQLNQVEVNSPLFVHDLQLLTRNLLNAPPDLAELCLQLLDADPSNRPSGLKILELLGHHANETADVSSCFMGREQELAALSEAGDRCSRVVGSNQLILLRGDVGMGKSTLLQHWLAHSDRDAYVVLSIRNYPHDHTPHRLMNSLVQELVRSWGLSRQVISQVFQPYVVEISQSFPQIEQLCETNLRPIPSTALTKDLVERSIHHLLDGIEQLSQIRPVIIAVDDAQWADASGLASLCGLLQQKHQFHGIVILAADLSGLKAIDIMCSNVASVVDLPLEPLDRNICSLMLADWSRQSNLVLSQAETRRLTSLGKGSPFLLRELFRSLLDQQFVSSDYQHSEVTVRQLVSRRFARMPRQAEVVLQYLVIADQPLLFQQLVATCRLTPLELQACLNLLDHQRWIRIRSDSIDTVAELASESFRDAIVDTMAQDRLERRHFRLARTLSTDIDPPWPRIAMHYEKAAKFRLAAACHIQAARDAFRTGANREVLYFIEKGSHKDAQRSVIEQQQLQLMEVESHALLGNSEKASQLLREFADEETDSDRAIELRSRAGDQLLRVGRLRDGLDLLRSAFFKTRVATGQPAYLRVRNSLSAWRIASRSIPSELTQHSSASNLSSVAVPNQQSLSNDTQSPLHTALLHSVIPLWFLEHDQAGALVARLATLSEDSAHSLAFKNQALLLACLLLSQSGLGYHQRAVQRFQLGMRIAKQLTTADATNCQLILLVWCLQHGRFRAARRHAEKAMKGVGYAPSWNRLFVAWNETNLHWLSGRLKKLLNVAEMIRDENQPLQQPMFEFWTNVCPSVFAELVLDNVEQACTRIASARSFVESEPLMQPKCYHWLSTVAVELYTDHWEAANRAVDQRWRWFINCGLHKFANLALAAYSLRINAALQEIRGHTTTRQQTINVQHWITQLKQTGFPALGHLADAYLLVFQAQLHGCRDFSRWQRVQAGLKQSGLTLYAQALQWHESLYADPSTGHRWQESAIESFREQGCVAPHRLMNLILPLPTKDA